MGHLSVVELDIGLPSTGQSSKYNTIIIFKGNYLKHDRHEIRLVIGKINELLESVFL
jgi:hypothetical protein